MTGLVAKLIIYPVTMLISNYVFGLDYSLAQAAFIALVLVFASHIIELSILYKGTLWISVAVDFITIFTIIYFSQSLLFDVSINILSALFTTLLISGTELYLHDYLIRTGKTKKEE
jgi:hypothetical protein